MSRNDTHRVVHQCNICGDDIKTAPSTKYRSNDKRICVYCYTDLQALEADEE